ncbi:hypothetical protein EOM09_01250, partial [bacterium]|nr:hypothetical protein [bacterium]
SSSSSSSDLKEYLSSSSSSSSSLSSASSGQKKLTAVSYVVFIYSSSFPLGFTSSIKSGILSTSKPSTSSSLDFGTVTFVIVAYPLSLFSKKILNPSLRIKSLSSSSKFSIASRILEISKSVRFSLYTVLPA